MIPQRPPREQWLHLLPPSRTAGASSSAATARELVVHSSRRHPHCPPSSFCSTKFYLLTTRQWTQPTTRRCTYSFQPPPTTSFRPRHPPDHQDSREDGSLQLFFFSPCAFMMISPLVRSLLDRHGADRGMGWGELAAVATHTRKEVDSKKKTLFCHRKTY